MHYLERRVLRRTIPVILLFLLCFFSLFFHSQSRLRSDPIESLNPASQNPDYRIVTVSVSKIYAAYYHTTVNGEMTTRQYIIDAGPKYFVGFEAADPTMISSADRIMYETKMAGRSGSLDELPVYQLEGILIPMPNEVLSVYHDYLSLSGYGAPEKLSHFIPCYLSLDYEDNIHYWIWKYIRVLSFLFLIAALILIYITVNAFSMKEVYQFFEERHLYAGMADALDCFIEENASSRGIWIHPSFFLVSGRFRYHIFDTNDLVWVYDIPQVYKGRLLSLLRFHRVVLVIRGRKRPYRMKIYTRRGVRSLYHRIHRVNPHILLEYHSDLLYLYRNDLDALLSLRYADHEDTEDAFIPGSAAVPDESDDSDDSDDYSDYDDSYNFEEDEDFSDDFDEEDEDLKDRSDFYSDI